MRKISTPKGLLINSALSIILTGALFTTTTAKEASFFEYQNPITQGIEPTGIRDSQVFRDGDWWYLTGTSFPFWPREETGKKEDEFNKGVVLYRSKNLKEWEFVDYVVKRPTSDKWYFRRFWAPEIHKINGKYYATFNCSNPDAGFPGQHLGYAVADKVDGPYTVVTESKPLTNGNDLTLFQDTDGKVWAFWNQGRAFGIGFAQIDLDTGKFLTEPQSAIHPGKVDMAFDKSGKPVMEAGYDGRPIHKVQKYYDWDSIGIEGAYVIKREDTYYLMYSSWTRGYEIGYATAPAVTGPWTKAKTNPIYGAQNQQAAEKNGFKYTGDKNNIFNQVGHNEVFTGPDGRLWISAHGITETGIPSLVIDPITFGKNGELTIEGPTYTKQSVPLNK